MCEDGAIMMLIVLFYSSRLYHRVESTGRERVEGDLRCCTRAIVEYFER